MNQHLRSTNKLKTVKKYFFALALLFLFSGKSAKAQYIIDTGQIVTDTIKEVKKPKYIVFTGLVLTSDSLKAIPWVRIRSQQRGRIGYTDEWGHFDVIVKQGDSVYFELSEKRAELHIIPDTLTDPKYQVVKLMVQDTFSFPMIFIHAMPPKSLFDYYFVTRDVPDDEYERARKNLEAEELKEKMKLQMADASESYKALMSQRASALYYYKQVPPQNWLSPVAWAKFLSDWKAGKFKKKKK